VAIFAETRITELFEMIDIVYPFPAVKCFSKLTEELCETSLKGTRSESFDSHFSFALCSLRLNAVEESPVLPRQKVQR